MLSLGKERLSGRVSVEDIPSGHIYLTSIMEAMTENHEIVIGYRKYTSSEESRYTLRPYAVKEVAKRWYLVAYCIEREALRVYGLDRITSLETTDKIFDMPRGFDVDEEFATSYGIYLPEGRAQTIVFRTTPKEALYLRDLPIHGSQKELNVREVHSLGLVAEAEMVYFSIFVCPNTDLVMEFCRRGGRVEVLAPGEVRAAVAGELRQAAAQYGAELA